jgi:FdhD protein
MDSSRDSHGVHDGERASTRAGRVLKWEAGATPAEVSDRVVVEEPLEIRVRGRAVSVTMRTPGHDEELAVGFLLGEGVIRGRGDVLGVAHCGRNEEGNVLDVRLAPEVGVDFEALTRHVFASSSCGLCGAATIEAVNKRFAPVPADDLRIPVGTIAGLVDVMRGRQRAFDETGGLHAAAIFDSAGRLVVIREDVGRHNAVDKVVGHCLLTGVGLDRHVLVVSGRSSFEIVQKALAARIPVVAAVSAPSSLAVEFAERNGQTLIGFLRGGRMNVYAHAGRVEF